MFRVPILCERGVGKQMFCSLEVFRDIRFFLYLSDFRYKDSNRKALL